MGQPIAWGTLPTSTRGCPPKSWAIVQKSLGPLSPAKSIFLYLQKSSRGNLFGSTLRCSHGLGFI